MQLTHWYFISTDQSRNSLLFDRLRLSHLVRLLCCSQLSALSTCQHFSDATTGFFVHAPDPDPHYGNDQPFSNWVVCWFSVLSKRSGGPSVVLSPGIESGGFDRWISVYRIQCPIVLYWGYGQRGDTGTAITINDPRRGWPERVLSRCCYQLRHGCLPEQLLPLQAFS